MIFILIMHYCANDVLFSSVSVIIESDDIRLVEEEMSHANNFLNKVFKMIFCKMFFNQKSGSEKMLMHFFADFFHNFIMIE